jgi:hypothetical protein
MRDSEFLSWVGGITGVPSPISIRNMCAAARTRTATARNSIAVDFNFHPQFGWHRRLNLIVFLNPQWEESCGDCLELLREPAARGDDVRRAVPLENRAVIFETTESSWHGFPVIATPHGTYFYQRPLPAYIQAGYTLREEDVTEIRKLLARRDDHIRYLYHRDREFTVLMDSINKWPALRLAHALTSPARALKRAVGK